MRLQSVPLIIIMIFSCGLERRWCSSSLSLLKNIDLVKSIVSSRTVVTEGQSLELECRISSRVSERAEIAWVKVMGRGEVRFLSVRRKEDGVIDYEEEYSSFYEEEEADIVWSLTLHNVDKRMAGLYQCEVLLEEEPVSSRKVVVRVDDIDQQTDPDNITYVLTTRRGQNVTLNCSDFGGEMISWRKEGDNTVSGRGSTFPLIQVDKSHSGVYTCSVSGSQRHLSVLVSDSPRLSSPVQDVTGGLGEEASLVCQVLAVPVAAVEWCHQGSRVQSHHSRDITIKHYQDGKMTSSLTVRNISEKDFGAYTCKASNSEGEESLTLHLIPDLTSGANQVSSVQVLITIFFTSLAYRPD